MSYVWETPLGPVYEGDEVEFSPTDIDPLGKLTAFFSDAYTGHYHSNREMTVRGDEYNYGLDPNNCHIRGIHRITNIIPVYRPSLVPEPLDPDII